MLVLRQGKMPRKELYKMAEEHTRIDMEIYRRINSHRDAMPSSGLRFITAVNECIRTGLLGKPLNHMKDYESNPGVWILDDTETGNYVMLYSDCHRKNAFKGTAVESPKVDKELVDKVILYFTKLAIDNNIK